MNRFMVRAGVAGLLVAAFGCGSPQAPQSGSTPVPDGTARQPAAGAAVKFEPIDASAAVFWDRQTNETAKLIEEIIGDFNKPRTGLQIKRRMRA
ncbi:MAG: hypothetical protein HZB26_02285 [Candidatus Hydrogenedentes bacterium]|nr:hypothetical protein [Candidatus Hydrogenedentota bacterium]